MKKLNVVFIGAGWVCTARHIPCFSKHPLIRCFGVVDTSESTARDVSKKFNMPNYSTSPDPQTIDWLSAADVICVTAPPMYHYKWLTWALDHNKHILTEKPVALGRKQGLELFEKARNYPGMFCVTHNTLFTKSAKKAREFIQSGKLGTVTDYNINLYNSPQRHLPDWYDSLPFGLLYDELSHFLYQADSICPNLSVHSAQVFASRTGLNATPSTAKITLLSQHLPVFLSLHFESPLCEWHITISGTKGMLIIDMFRDIFVFIPNDNEHRAIDQIRTILCGIGFYMTGFIASGIRHFRKQLLFGTDEVINKFIDGCTGSKAPKLINLDAAERIYNLLCDCIDALEKGRVDFNSKINLPKF